MSKTIVIAPNYPWATDWCRSQDPPIHPQGRGVLILTSRHNVHRLMGLRLEDWRVVVLDWPLHGEDRQALHDALLAAGWPGADTEGCESDG